MIDRYRLLACASASSLAFGLCSVPTAAHSQATTAPAADTASPPAATPADDTQIVITAQKRAENVQKVPISVAAFSGQALAKNNVLNVEQLSKIVPNFSAAKGAQATYLRLAIRGIGTGSNTTVEPSVAVFLDGAYVPRVGAAISSLLDVDSVEVLRGPQGTLFGRNASVGAVSFHTAQPKLNQYNGEVTGEIGNGERYKLTGVVNVPVGEHAALRLAGSQQWFNGYWHNRLEGGRRVGGTDETILRGSFRANLGPIDWVFRADYSKLSGDAATNIDFDRSSVSDARWNAFIAKVGAPDTDLNDNILNQFLTADLNDKQWGVNNTISMAVGDSTIRLIDNYRDWTNDQLDGDVIFTPTPILSRVGVFDSKSQNHELQFISPAREWLDGHLDLVAGLYYFHEKYHQGERLNENARFCNVLAPPALFNACTALRGTGLNKAVQDVHQTTDSYAGYAQANFHFTDQIFATAGGRYSKDKKSGDYKQTADPFLAASARAPESLIFPDIDDSRFTYRLGLNYEPTKDMLFFATYSTGYKSAGYNSGAGFPSLTPGNNVALTRRLFDREITEDWELGGKTSWLNHALTLNLTFYRMNIKGFQDRAFDGTSFSVRNAGNLRHQGFEFDGVARPLAKLSLFANLAYLHSEFIDYPKASALPGFPAGATQDLKGKPATFAPKWSGRVGVDWTGDVGSTGYTWDLNSNLSFTSKFYGGLQNDANPQTIVDGYALLSARATINAPGNRWSVALFANNLLNKQYEAGNLYQFLDGPLGLKDPVTGNTGVRRLHADPRTYGVSLTGRF